MLLLLLLLLLLLPLPKGVPDSELLLPTKFELLLLLLLLSSDELLLLLCIGLFGRLLVALLLLSLIPNALQKTKEREYVENEK